MRRSYYGILYGITGETSRGDNPKDRLALRLSFPGKCKLLSNIEYRAGCRGVGGDVHVEETSGDSVEHVT